MAKPDNVIAYAGRPIGPCSVQPQHLVTMGSECAVLNLYQRVYYSNHALHPDCHSSPITVHRLVRTVCLAWEIVLRSSMRFSCLMFCACKIPGCC